VETAWSAFLLNIQWAFCKAQLQIIVWLDYPLLGNGLVNTFTRSNVPHNWMPTARHWTSKHAFLMTEDNVFSGVPTEELWEGTVRRQDGIRVEAGSNTSTMTLRVVGGDKKGSLKSETVKYGHGSQGTQTQERLRWRGPAAYTKDRPILPSERAPQKNKTVTVKE
jgi:hypothetical protein